MEECPVIRPETVIPLSPASGGSQTSGCGNRRYAGFPLHSAAITLAPSAFVRVTVISLSFTVTLWVP